MDSIRVYINDTEIGYYKIEDTGVTFTWQAKLIGEINSFSTTTTKTITLPLTKALKILLKSPDVIDTTNSLSSREYFTIDVKWNDTVAVEGYIKLQKVVIIENDEYIEFSVEPKEKNWITQFKDFKLTELDFTLGATDQTHALTYANIVASETSNPYPAPGYREYVYAPIDIAETGRLQVIWITQTTVTNFYYLGKEVVAAGSTFWANTYGFNDSSLTKYNIEFTGVADAFWNARGIYVASTLAIPYMEVYGENGFMYVLDKDPYLEVSDFYPSIRHKDILRRCFNKIGYAATLIDSSEYFNDKYNFLHNIEQVNKFEETRNKSIVRSINPNNIHWDFSITTATTKEIVIPFRKLTTSDCIVSANYTDTNSDTYANIDAGTNVSKYTAPEAVMLGFEWDYKVRYKRNATFTIIGKRSLCVFRMKQYDSGGVLRRTSEYAPLTETATLNKTFDFEGKMRGLFYMEAGDYVTCTLFITTYASFPTTTVYVYNTNTLKNVYYDKGNYKNKVIRLNEYLPEIPAYDYIKDLSFINNWEFYTNEKLKQVYIVREDHKRTGKQIDFKQKLNIKKPVDLEEIGIKWPKKIYFNWKEDKDDWCIKFIEQVNKASLATTYKPDELEMAKRFGMGLITNLNLFTIEVQEMLNNVYSASLDKFVSSNNINFNTVEMKGEEQYPHAPSFKRTDYEPRYLTITFGTTLETNGIGGVTGVVYSIEGNTNHTTYPWASFLDPLHYGTATGLLVTKYAKRTRAIKYGWILRGKFSINENDVNTFVETYEDNNFRGDYELQLKGVKQKGELLKVNDFSPATFDQTEIEFIIYRDDL